jgi:hypothetical protein
VPLSARAGRVARAGLVESELSGDRLESARLRLRLDRLPVQLLSERHRVDGGDWLTLSGLELRYRLAPLPLVGLPAVELAAGAGRAGGAGTRAGTRWWLGLVFPPRPAAPAAPGIPRGSVSAPGVPALDSFP